MKTSHGTNTGHAMAQTTRSHGRTQNNSGHGITQNTPNETRAQATSHGTTSVFVGVHPWLVFVRVYPWLLSVFIRGSGLSVCFCGARSAPADRDPSEDPGKVDPRASNLLLLVSIRQPAPMHDGAEDADALPSRCGGETPDVNATVPAAKTVRQRRWRVPGSEAWGGQLEPDPQSAISPDLAGLEDARIGDQRGTGSRRDGERIQNGLADWLGQ